MLEGKKVLKAPQEKNKTQTIRNNAQNVKARRTSSVSPGCNNSISPGQRFSLPLEHCTPCPAPGPLTSPLTSPLLGGLPGNSPLTGGPAASFRLAQLKAQLALTHMNNVFAVGGQAVTLTANTNTPPSRFPSTPPSPTAVAINLLNLLKIANTMSHPLYNPFVSGKPSSSQGQYGLASGQTERDPRKVPPLLGSATSFGSSGRSSLTPGTSGGSLPSLLGLSVNYRPERGRITVDEEIERCLDLNISKAREEVRLQSLNQNPHFTSSQRDQFPSSSTGMTSYLTSSVSQGHQPSSGNRSLDWLPICKLATEDNTSKIHSSASSSFVGSSDGRFNTSSDGKRDVQSIPGLGEYDKPMPDKFVPSQESSRPKYTSESASNILLHFGLEKEDLEHLISYPEDQITPENLPFILRQIRVDKEKRTTAVQSKPYSEPQPITTVSGMNKLAPASSRGTVLNQDEISSIVLKPSKVIDYGHTGKYTTGAADEIGRAVSSTAKVGSEADTYKNISHGREARPKSTTEFKSGSFVSSHGQMSSVTSFSTSRSSMAPPSSGPTKHLETQPLPKSLPLKQPEPGGQPACNLFRGVHPGRPGLVLIGSNESQNSNRNLIQMSKPSEQMKNLQGQQQMKRQPRQQTQPHQAQPPQQQPRIISGMKPGPPPPNIPVHLARHQPVPNLMTIVPGMLVPPPKERFQAQMVLPKHLPIPSMMQDYAAATPTIFPHTCSLCIKECTTMKDWLIHQNTHLHLDNCRLLRTRYPDWNGETSKLQSAPRTDAQPLPSTSAEISLSHHQKSRLASPSRSHSPHRLRGLLDGRQKRSSRSRSRSPRRHHIGSEERRQKRSSRSPHHHYAPENRRERRSSRSRSPYSSQQSRRSNPRSLTPRNDRPTSSRYRSRSRSHERRASPRRREDRRSSPRRSHERRLSPRRSDDKRSSPRRSFERRSSADRSLPQRRRSRSAERLAKRLLETTAVQSLSKKSDLEAMVKTLAPALLAELTKMKSSPSAASSSSPKSTKLKPSLQKSGTSSSTQHKSDTASVTAKVRIKANTGSLSQHDVTAAVEKFGKIKSVVLFRSSKEAVVCFEKEEDADKLRAMRNFDVNKLPVSIIKIESTGPKKTQSTKEKKTPTTKDQKAPTTKDQKAPTTKDQKAPTTKDQKAPTTKDQKAPTTKQKSAKSSVSTTQTTKSSSSAKVKTPSSGAKNTTTSNVPKSKVLVSKAKNVSPKQVAKTANANGKRAAKSEEVKKETSVVSKSKSTEKRPEAGESKPKTAPTKSEINAKKSAVTSNETAKAKEQSNTSVTEPIKKEKIVTEAKKLASKEETSSTAQKPKMQPEQVAPPEAVKKEQVAETCANDNNLTSKSANQPGAAETKVQESTPVHKDTNIDVETKEATASEIKHLKECLRVDVKTEDVEPGVPEETGATEPMEVESSVESKDQSLTETKTLPTKPPESHPGTTAVKTSPCSSPPKPSNEPAQRVKEVTLLEMSSQVQPSASPHSGSDVEDHKTEAKTLETPTEMRPEDQVTGVKPHRESAPEPVSNISAGSPEAASSAKTQPADETESHQQTAAAASCAADVTTSTVKEKMEKHQQQEQIGCVQTETVVSSTSAPPDLSNNEEQTTPQESTSVSSVPTTSAKSTPSDSVREESVDTDMKETVVDSTISHETSEAAKEEQSPKTPVPSADKQSIPAGFSTTVSVTDPVKTEENAVELPHINEDIFKAFTTVLREHKRTKETRTKSKEKESTTTSKTTSSVKEEDTQNTKAQDEDISSDIFNEPDFNFEDFVTVDEISEDMEDTAVVHDSSSLSNPSSNKRKERQSSNVTPPSKRTTSRTSKDCKSSTSASSSSSSSARSSKTSLSSSSKSVETRVSPGQKAQPSKTKTPNRASQTSSKGRSTLSSTTAVKTSVETHQSHKKESKPTDSTVAEIDHEVSAESSAAKTVESESKPETLEMDSRAQGEKSEITHQSHSLETALRDETEKEVKTSKEKEIKMDEDGKITEEDEDYENFQIIDSLDEQTDEQINEKDKDSIIETQTLGPEKDQILHQECLQVSETADNDGKANPEASGEMEINPSFLVQDSADKIKAVTADDEDKGSTVMQESEDAAPSVHNSEKSLVEGAAHKNQVLDQDTNQTPRSRGDGANEKEIDTLSEELRRTSKEADQISDEHKPLENDSKDTEQEASVNSADDQTITKDEKIEAPNQETSQTDAGPTEEEEDVYQVIDSLEDQPTTETEPETNEEKQTKKGSATTSRGERPTRSSRSKSRTSKIEDKGKSPKKQNITEKKHETSVKDSKTKRDEKIESSEEMVFEVVDSIEDDPVQEASTTRSSGRRQSARRHKEDEKTLNLKEGPDKSNKKEEMVYKVLDSVGEETSSEKPATRSTRGRKEKNEKSNENEKTKQDKTPTRRRHTPSRDSHEKDKEKTSKTSVNDPLKGSTPTKSDTVVRDTSEEEVTYEIIDAVEEEADDKLTTQKSRRGRPKKDVKPTKKQTKASKGVDLPCKVAEEEEAAAYQILDSVEGEIDDQATTDQTENKRKSTLSTKDEGTTKKRTRSSKKKEEEEPLYQVVDSLEDDQEELIRDVSGVQEEKSDTKDKKADSVPSGSSAIEAFKKAGSEDLLQGVKDAPSAEGSKTERKSSSSESDVKQQEESLTKSKRDAAKSEKAMQKSPKKKDTTASKNAVVSLDEVSDEEEDYPDDTVEKEKIKKIQAASEGRENKQENRTREKDTREQKSRSRSRGGSGEVEKKTKEMSQEKEEKVEAESQELVTLDEVGEDEAEEEGVRETPKGDRMLMEEELQELVTLDEIDEEDGKEKPRTLEALSLSQESQPVDSLKPEILSALDEAAHDEDKKADKDTKETSSSVKRKLDDNTEESEDFVTVDEVGTTEEEDQKPATRGQLKKRSRLTPVKHSTGGTMDSKEQKEEEKESIPPGSVDLSSAPDKHSSALSGDVKLEIQRTEIKTETVSTEQQLNESPDEQKLDGCEEKKEEKGKRSRVEVTAVDKRSQELTEPEAKRPRSESPSLPVDFKLPPFNPKSPLGQEFVVPKSGFFCNLCSIFYFKENVAKGTHCSTQKHYDNLLKHYQKLQQKTSSSLTQNSQGSVSDGSN